jgi:hypothetical protein
MMALVLMSLVLTLDSQQNIPTPVYENRAMAEEDLKAELERLKAENEALKQGRRGGPVSMKVSEKGAVSVYGLGRFPVTLYQEQWLKLLAIADEIKSFIAENKDRLKAKES